MNSLIDVIYGKLMILTKNDNYDQEVSRIMNRFDKNVLSFEELKQLNKDVDALLEKKGL